jgi:dipeptidyl aminopeptidase/acylaminoacyl peptidase
MEYELEPYLPKFYWNETDRLYFENTIRGNRGLFALSPTDGKVTSLINSSSCDEQFSFSRDSQRVAYVHQSIHEAPEIYISDFPFKEKRKLSSLNAAIKNIKLPETERVIWPAPDGVQVEGTLFKPINYTGGKAYPLLVFVHGGPNIAIENRFEPYSIGADWIWPYPFRIFANRGYAVFLPDYRGTGSYGKRFRETRDILKDPSEDIVSGIDFLIKKGVADPNNIGILGQSHGAWLGPCVMAHNRIFKAASFAEGSGNLATNYAQMPGWSNLNVHEYYYDGSPYDNPRRYLELSPVFSFKGMTTATLLEYGEKSLAVQGLELQSALWRQGVPHEMVIYPKTGHNISSPTLMLESIKRNLDWFDYWMLGTKDPDSSKQAQYERWEAMKLKMDKMRSRKSLIQRSTTLNEIQ